VLTPETLTQETVDALAAAYDVVLLDVGDTLVAEAEPGTATAHLVAHPMPGVLDTLHRLHGRVRLGAVTNTSVMREGDVRSILEGAGVNGLLEVVVTSTDVGAAKPDPRPVLVALDRIGATPARALYVGDRSTDRTAALAAGARFAATDRGLPDALTRAAGALQGSCAAAVARVCPPDRAAMDEARARHDVLTKPAGSLGALEDLGVLLAGIARACPPPVPDAPAVGVFAADHGVVASGVTPWPQAVTAQMVANFAGGGAAINAIAAQVGASLRIVDVGVASDAEIPGVEQRRVRAGTADLSVGPAMTVAEARAALDIGAGLAAELLGEGHDLLATGDMGIGNTTASAALIAVLTGRSAVEVTGRGTGIDDEMLGRKTAIVETAAARARPLLDPVSVLAEVGGLEIAALAGFMIGGVAARVPVVVDGLIALAALLVADALAPGTARAVVAGHRSTEPGASIALDHLELTPLLDLGMRLGEGTGACLAVPVVQAAARVLAQMATFDEAAISEV
jgi:nicotinate-nucleotide--dimethylbenzimidazole phosphoribosyltransferase